jgi:hypothetical protein
MMKLKAKGKLSAEKYRALEEDVAGKVWQWLVSCHGTRLISVFLCLDYVCGMAI